MKNRPDDERASRSAVDQSGGIRPGSERNRRFAEELERKSAVTTQVRRKPLANRIGDVGQGGARGFAHALKRTPTKVGIAGRVGKRPTGNSIVANKALKRAQDMLRDTERELANLKRQNASTVRFAPSTRGRGTFRGGRGGGRGAGRGGGGFSRGGSVSRGRGGGARGGARGARGGGRGGSVKVSQSTLDKQLDSYMMKTKGGLDAQMDEYMSKTKTGLDKQMDEYMAAKSK